ncbi:MAG: PIN domain-containing protein [Gammaproteobacteria bacterium]
MTRYLLDTSALLALRDNEPGAERVEELLRESQQGKTRCLACFISLMEVMYRVWRDEDESRGRLAYEQCLALPIEWVHESADLLKRAAEVKARWRMSVADAWIAACALENAAILVHKDPEFKSVPVQQDELRWKA